MCPNHIVNNISFLDSKNFNKYAVNTDKAGNKYVDFNILKPMPKDLIGTYCWEEKETILKPYLLSLYNENLTQEEFINKVREDVRNKDIFLNILKTYYYIEDIDKTGEYSEVLGQYECTPFESVIGGFYNENKYNFYSWYDWARYNWSTKWNAYECYFNEFNVTFNTAWSCPINWLQELAQHVDFRFSFADEDLGSNFGYGIARDKVLTYYYLDDNADLDFYDKQYLAIIIRGNDYEEELELYEQEEKISEERQQELYDMIKDYL